jgi:uncharacterized protein YjbI with pentapeptide repeats
MIPKRKNLEKTLNEHSRWIFSSGRIGKLADVRKWNLDKFNLENEEFPFAKLQFVSLRGAKLSGINFRQADLLMGNFMGAYLDGADLEGANLSGCDFSFSKCMRANFANANLEGANFEGADLSETNFAKAILHYTNFKGANLSAAEMIDADIEGANLQGANLEDTNFEGTDLFKAEFDKTYLSGLNVENIEHPEADQEDTNFSSFIENEKGPPQIGPKNHRFDKTRLNLRPSIKSSKEDLIVDIDAIKPNMIEEAINDLIEKVKSNIQPDELKTIFTTFKNENLIDKKAEIDFKHGDIVANNGQVAFQLDFKISYDLSLLLNRNGKLIKFIARSRDKLINKDDLK